MNLFGFTFVRISGPSMEPVLEDGNFALFHRPLFRACKVERGDIVLVDHPDLGLIVKRAREVATDGAVALEGISPVSTPADMLGSVAPRQVRGLLVKSWAQ